MTVNWCWQAPLNNLSMNVVRLRAVWKYHAEVLFHADLRLCQHLDPSYPPAEPATDLANVAS